MEIRNGTFSAMGAVVSVLAAALVSSACSSGEEVYDRLRESMVREQIAARGISDRRVLASMTAVPRHLFVPAGYRASAYIDSPLPIGAGQTISQPYIVALMTESLALEDSARVLEVGTGSGYQAAVLAGIADSVFSVEIIPELAARASALLDSLGYSNVAVRAGDGFFGWPGKSPFDGIIVTAAAPSVPERLVEQLRAGGRLVIPVGSVLQKLRVYVKEDGGLRMVSSTPVRFVPMTGRISGGGDSGKER